MRNVFLRCGVAVICHALRRKDIIVRYDKVFADLKAMNVFKRKAEIGLGFESLGIFCKKIASKEVRLEYCTLCVYLQPKTLIVSVKLPYNVDLKLEVRKGGCLKEFSLGLRNFSLEAFKKIFANNIISAFMGKMESRDRVDIDASYTHDNARQFPRILYSMKTSDGFSIAPSALHIDKDYIVNLLKQRNHLGQHYIAMADIPAKVWKTVICTEDPMFLLHNGFCDITLAMALRNAINSRHLSVGGSTITQQLVKNAMLNSERTLYRKAEELILALLIENYYQVPKKDILEAYLNMIELAPNIYGIEDGARFYFDKDCRELGIIEVLALTYAIPRPLFFHEALENKSAQLSKNLYSHISTFYPSLIKKGIVEENEADMKQLDGIMFGHRFGFLKMH